MLDSKQLPVHVVDLQAPFAQSDPQFVPTSVESHVFSTVEPAVAQTIITGRTMYMYMYMYM